MIVDHLNTGVGGGAAIAARRLHQALRAAGVESRFWYARQAQAEMLEPGCQLLPRTGRRQRLPGKLASGLAAVARRLGQKGRQRWALAGRPPGFDLFNTPRRPRATPWTPPATPGDILHLHWVAKMIDYPSLFASIPRHMPVVWTLHDLHPLTGGCHYPSGCEAYVTGCGNCPQLGRSGTHDLSRRSLRIKRDAVRGKNLHVVAPSRWAADCARRSQLLGDAASIRTIHHGVDVRLFAPQEKAAAKRALGLDPQSVVIGFGATAIEDRRKGLQLLLSALSALRGQRHFVGLVFGSGNLPRPPTAPVELTLVGYLEDPRAQATVYSASDIFVVPSLEEIFGLTGLEALACGTPVVAFDCGGMADYVRPLESGLRARPGDGDDLARQIEWLIDRPQERRRLGAGGRELACREFDVQQQAARHIALYCALRTVRAGASTAGYAA